jgi:ribose transport system permease protein
VTQTLAPPPPAGAPSRESRLRGIDWRSYAIYIGFAVVFLLFAIFLADDGFLSGTNLLNIFRQTAIISVMAVAMTFVISAAQIDLSIGSVAGLSSVCAALAISATGSALFGVLAGLAVGLAVGMYNAIFGGGNLGPIPGLLLWTVVAVAIGWVVLNKTRFGRQVLATGGNRVAAEYTGVNTRRITFTVMLVSSVVAAIAGMLYAGRLESGRYQWGTGDELSVIAAVILGGTSLFGGAGSVIGALFGSLLIGLINNGLILAGFDNSQQQIIRGLIIIVAVALARKK